jgi:hypothetical protein
MWAFSLVVMATASHTAVPGFVSESGTGSLSLARDPEAPQAAASHAPSIGTAAAQLGAAAARAAVGSLAGSSTADGKPPPRQPLLLPAWLSLLIAAMTGTGGIGAGAGVVAIFQGEGEVEQFKAEVRADVADIRDDFETDRASLHKNDAALGKWAVDMTKDVSTTLVNLDTMVRALAEAQGINTDDIRKPAIAEPGVTIRRLGIQAEAEGL